MKFFKFQLFFTLLIYRKINKLQKAEKYVFLRRMSKFQYVFPFNISPVCTMEKNGFFAIRTKTFVSSVWELVYIQSHSNDSNLYVAGQQINFKISVLCTVTTNLHFKVFLMLDHGSVENLKCTELPALNVNSAGMHFARSSLKMSSKSRDL